MRSTTFFAVGIFLLGSTLAQFPPTPKNVTVARSKSSRGVTVSYKEPGICETTPGVKSYAGYVRLPPETVQQGQDYSINAFFWFFESRKDPKNAPFVIWVDGATGGSTLNALLSENGPCNVNMDGNSTTLNPWSWNNEVNLLYIDSATQTGFSYDKLSNGSTNEVKASIDLTDFPRGVPAQNNTFKVGTFPSLDETATPNNTMNAARTLWHITQAWFQEFIIYKPKNDKISIFAESYGGRLGPAFGAFLMDQNDRISKKAKQKKGEGLILHLDTLGLVNGCVDTVAQERSYPEILYNNTYGLSIYNETFYDQVVRDFNQPDTGCLALITKCRALADKLDPGGYANNEKVNAACRKADGYCMARVEERYYDAASRADHDIAAPRHNPYPPSFLFGFLARHWVQAALGVPLNYTAYSDVAYRAFVQTGDSVRGGRLADIGNLLDRGVKVAMMYGDRDYSCNWMGGENVSLAINHRQKAGFQSAGYTDIKVNSSYVGGQVRQHGNISFSRVYQAGRQVPFYQPETAYQIFQRAIFGLDIATGKSATGSLPIYHTKGSPTTFQVKNVAPDMPTETCHTLNLLFTCNDMTFHELATDPAVIIHNFIYIDESTTHLFPGLVDTANGTGGRLEEEKPRAPPSKPQTGTDASVSKPETAAATREHIRLGTVLGVLAAGVLGITVLAL